MENEKVSFQADMDSKTVEFAVFCIENVAVKLSVSGDRVYEMLTTDSDILDEYIIPNSRLCS